MRTAPLPLTRGLSRIAKLNSYPNVETVLLEDAGSVAGYGGATTRCDWRARHAVDAVKPLVSSGPAASSPGS